MCNLGSLLFSLRCGKASSKPPRPYLVSRPLAGGNPYATGMYPQHEDVKEHEEVEMDIEKIQRQTIQTSQASTVGQLTLEIVAGDNLPKGKRGPNSLFVAAFVGFREKQVSSVQPPSQKPNFDFKYTFNQVSVDQALVIELWKAKKMHKKMVSSVSIDLLQQNIEYISDLQAEDPDCDAEVGQDFKRDLWIPISDANDVSVLHVKISFEYFNGGGAETALKEIAALDMANRRKGLGLRKAAVDDKKFLFAHSTELGRPSTRPFQLRAHFFVGRNLLSTHSSDGKADLLVYIRCWGKTLTLPALPVRTANPRWFRTVTCNINLPVPLELAPDISVTFFGEQKVGRPIGLCRFQVTCKEARAMNTSQSTKGNCAVATPRFDADYIYTQLNRI